MSEIFFVWNVLFANNDSDEDEGLPVDRSVGVAFYDADDAYDYAKRLIFDNEAERVMVIALRPWTAADLMYTMGSFSGKECLDWVGTERKIQRSLNAAVAAVSAQYDLVKKVEVTK